jgi:hypothetical protein
VESSDAMGSIGVRQIEPDESGKDTENHERVRPALKKPSKSRPTETSIYFIQCNAPDGPIKIGHAYNVESRLSNLQMGCPFRLTLLARCVVTDAIAIEQHLHRLFWHQRIRGEWFAASPTLLDLVDRVAMQHIERIASILDHRPPPALPPELVPDPVEEVAPEYADEIRAIFAEARIAAKQRRAQWSAKPKVRKPKPPREPGPGEFVWRGKIRQR